MTFIEALILGIIQGLTEFLPVSSSGHIELGKVILDVHVKDPLLFSIVVHGATALSTIVVFRKVILELILELFRFKWNEATQYITMIALSMIPVGVVGVLYEDEIEKLFDGNILLVGFMLLVTGLLLYITTRVKINDGKVTFGKAIIIGLSQAIAIAPGISRSGATISTALLLGINKERAARFSFLMVLPPILGATLLKTKKYFGADNEVAETIIDNADAVAEVGALALATGFGAAFIAGLLACTWMVNLVKRGKLQYFAIYCGVVGIIAIAYSLLYA